MNNLRTLPEWDTLRRVLLNAKQSFPERLCYVPNQGNAGDALIASGMWQLFDELGIHPTVCTTEEIKRDDVAIYSGGGNLVPEYSNCRDFLTHCLLVRPAQVILLPHTIKGNEELLAKLNSTYFLFCREMTSFEYATRAAKNANVHFCHDMAFYLSLPALIPRHKGVGPLIAFLFSTIRNPKQFVKALLWMYYVRLLNSRGSSSLVAYRVDAESPSNRTGNRQFDVSNRYGSKYLSRVEVDYISASLLTLLASYKSVTTNRLHLGVGGALVGGKVALEDNSYGKNSAIYKATLFRFQNVDFIE